MRLKIALISSALLVAASVATAAPIKSEQDKLSYTIGVDLGKNFKKQGISISPEVLVKGFQDAQSNGKLQMSDQEMRQTLQGFQTKILKKKAEQFQKVASKNKTDGAAFLAANKKKKGVVTLDSGLQYRVIKEGSGSKPAGKDTVTVDYTGKFIDGKVFESTKKSGKPVTFEVDKVIPGWSQALQLMKKGATWEVYIPSKLAYGPRGVMGSIGPNQTLIFKIHLLSIKKS